MRRITVLVIVCLSAAVVFGQGQWRYSSDWEYCSFDLPEGWHEVPLKLVSELEDKLYRPRMKPETITNIAVFQQSGDKELVPPFLILGHVDTQNVPVYKVEKFLKSTSNEELIRMQKKEAKLRFVKQVYESISAPEIHYDSKRHMSSSRCELELPGLGKCVEIDATILGKGVCISLNIIGRAEDFEQTQDTFDMILGSFSFEEGYEFQPDPVTAAITKAVKVALIVIGALILLFIFKRVRDR